MNLFNLSPSGGKRKAIYVAYVIILSMSTNIYGSAHGLEEAIMAAPPTNSYTTCLQLNESVDVSIELLHQESGPNDYLINQIGNPVHGNATILPNGLVIRYTASSSYFVKDSVQFEICNTNNECESNWLFINYVPANQLSTSCDYGIGFVNQPIQGNVLYNDYNYDLRKIEVATSFLIQPEHGQVILKENGEYLYIPEKDFVGKDQFSYLACTESSPRYCEKNTVFLTIQDNKVECENVIGASTDCIEIPTLGLAQINVLANDKNLRVQGFIVNTTLVTEPSYGNATIDKNGVFTYKHTGSILKEDFASYEICFQSNTCVVCDTGRIAIKIEDAYFDCQNMRASIIDDQLFCCKGHAIVGNIFKNDVDYSGNIISSRVDISNLPKNGTLKEGSNGDFIYRPDPGFCGADQFGYIVCFSNGECDRSTVHIEIFDKTTPKVKDDKYDVTSVNCKELRLEDNDEYLDGFDWNTFEVIKGGASGTFRSIGRGVEYCPLGGGYSGNDTIRYTVKSQITPCQEAIMDTGEIILRVLPFLSINHDFKLKAELSERGVELSWNPLDSEKNKNVVIQKNIDQSLSTIYDGKNDAGSLLDSDCVDGKTYLYRIGSKDEKTTYFSNWISISTNEAKIDQPFVINQKLLCPLENLTNVSVSNINGQTVRKMNSIKECVHFGDLPSGIYVIQFRSQNKMKNKLIYL